MRVLFAAVVFAAGCATVSAAGTYEVVLPAASGGGERHIRVNLHPDGTAAVTSAFSGRPSQFLAEGLWAQEGSQITVRLSSERMVFHRAGDQLIAKEWDRAAWGEAGPGVLYRLR